MYMAISVISEKDSKSYRCDHIAFVSWVSMALELSPVSLVHPPGEMLEGRRLCGQTGPSQAGPP